MELMALRIITDCPANGMTLKSIADMSTDDPADRVSLKAVLSALQSTPDYLPEERAFFGFARIRAKLPAPAARRNAPPQSSVEFRMVLQKHAACQY